ncbi:hypothetical protein GA0070215_1041, partial [Micromonospora marina]
MTNRTQRAVNVVIDAAEGWAGTAEGWAGRRWGGVSGFGVVGDTRAAESVPVAGRYTWCTTA